MTRYVARTRYSATQDREVPGWITIGEYETREQAERIALGHAPTHLGPAQGGSWSDVLEVERGNPEGERP